MEAKTKVLVVEDEVMIAKHIEDALRTDAYNCVGIAHDSETALDLIYNRNPEFVILDINIEGSKDGIEIAEIINAKYQIPFMFLTAFSDVKTLDRAKKVNPCGYIVKPFKSKDLISTLTIGMYNYLGRSTKTNLSLHTINSRTQDPLTQKEYEVLMDIKEGFTNAQIAKKQFLSISTIKFHSQNIYSKLGVSNRMSAVKKITEFKV